MKLSATEVKSTASEGRDKKLFDGGGLYLLIKSNGGKYWRLKYRINRKEKTLALGVYPTISLAEARVKRDEARKLIADGKDPSAVKQAEKVSGLLAAENSFQVIATEWHKNFYSKWTPAHADRILSILNKDIFPWLGKKPITAVETPELLKTLKRISNRGAVETAHRTNQICAQIFAYAIASGRAINNPAINLRGALPPVKKKRMATLKDKNEIGKLLRAINDYHGQFTTKCALKLAPLLFVRPGELRNAEWRNVSLETAEWRIPAEKMKMRREHLVPLAKQAIEILKELKPLTGKDKYLFPSVRSTRRPMSNNTLNAALRGLGFTKEQITSHGFRSIASTILNEHHWPADVIERQLAHAEPNKIRDAYNNAEYLPKRKEMMQWWADYLFQLERDTKA